MNNGKTHAFFTWAHSDALVPPPLPLVSPPDVPEHDNYTIPHHSSGLVPPWHRLYATEQEGKLRRGPAPEKLALHDPLPAAPIVEQIQTSRSAFSTKFPKHITSTANLFPRSTHEHVSHLSLPEWVKPDYVVKADDDSFVILAELEARLRWELWEAKRDADAENGGGNKKEPGGTSTTRSVPDTTTSSTEDGSSTAPRSEPVETSAESSTTMQNREFPEGMVLGRRDWGRTKASVDKPLIYWGCEYYLFSSWRNNG
jgi:hypothetical protein